MRRYGVVAAAAGLVVGLAVGVALGGSTPEEAKPDFWGQLSYRGVAVEAEQYHTLSDAITSADLVVRGMADSVAFGRIWGDIEDVDNQVPSVLINIKVAEVIRGTLPVPDLPMVTIERSVLTHRPEDLRAGIAVDGLDLGNGLAGLPTNDALFILRVRGDQGSEIVGSPTTPIGGESYRLVSSQGLIGRGNDGFATMPLFVFSALAAEDGRDPGPEAFGLSVLSMRYGDVLAAIKTTP